MIFSDRQPTEITAIPTEPSLAFFKWQNVRCSLGFGLILCGQPIAWAARGSMEIQSGAIFAAVPVILGMLFMMQPRWILQRRIYSDALLLSIPILLIALPFAALSLVHVQEIGALGAYAVCLAMIAILFGMNESEAYSQIPLAVLLLGLIGSLAPMVQFLMGSRDVLIRLAIEGNSNTLVVANIGGLTALAAVVVSDTIGRNRVWVGILSSFAFTVGLAAVTLSNTRSTLLALLACVPLYVFYLSGRIGRLGRKTSKRGNFAFLASAVVLLGLLPLLLASLLNPDALDIFVRHSADRLLGAANFLSQSGAEDTSSSERVSLLLHSWNGLDPIGKGMMADTVARGDGYYPHLTYLQAFYDLGFFGGAVFLIAALILPAALIVLRLGAGPLRPSDAFVILLFIFYQGDHFFHAVPYSWMSLLPVILVYALFSRLHEVRGSTGDAAIELLGRPG